MQYLTLNSLIITEFNKTIFHIFQFRVYQNLIWG